jgi:hypothetical protein
MRLSDLRHPLVEIRTVMLALILFWCLVAWTVS